MLLFMWNISDQEQIPYATFEDGEVLIVEDTFTYGNTTVSAGETIATVVSNNATSIGSIAFLRQGVFYKGLCGRSRH